MSEFNKRKAFGIGGVLTGVAAVIAVAANISEIIQLFKGDDKPEKTTATTSVVETVEKTTKATKTKQEDVIEVDAVEQAEPETEPPTEAQPAVVYLDSLKVAERKDHFSEEETNAEDTVGNTYTGHLLTIGDYCGGEDEDYAMYYLGGKYKTLTGTIAVHDETQDSAIAELFILCDENPVYTTGQISRAFVPTEISVNIENCQWLKISKITYGDKYYAYPNTFILSNFKLE